MPSNNKATSQSSTSSITVSTSYLGDDYDNNNPKYNESCSLISSSINIPNDINDVVIKDDYDDDDDDSGGEDDGVNRTFLSYDGYDDDADDPNDYSENPPYDAPPPSTTRSSSTPSLPLLIELIRQRQFNSIDHYIKRYPEDLTVPLSSSLSTPYYSKDNNGNNDNDDDNDDGPHQTLPLHYLVSLRPFPPHYIVRAFINAYPPSVSCRETIWGYLPLHLACRHHPQLFQPSITTLATIVASSSSKNDDYDNNDEINRRSIIRDLIDVYPLALRYKESFRGMLPLHLAVDDNEASSVIVELLIRAFPEGVLARDDFGDLPIHVNVHRGGDDAERQRRVNNMLRCVMNEFDESQRSMMKVNPLPVIDEGRGMNTGCSSTIVTEDNSILSSSVMTVASQERGDSRQQRRQRRRLVFHLSGYHLSKRTSKGKLLQPLVPLGKCKSSNPWAHPKKPNPYFEFYVKRRRRQTKPIKDTNDKDTCCVNVDDSSSSSSYWKLIYKSHPQFNTSSPTWNNISIDLTPHENEIKITLCHCDTKKKYNNNYVDEEDYVYKWGSIETSVSKLTDQREQWLLEERNNDNDDEQQPYHCHFFHMTGGTREATAPKRRAKAKEKILGITNAVVIVGDEEDDGSIVSGSP